MKVISLFNEVGDFAEDKDKAAKIRNELILPELKKKHTITIDFDKVTLVTQSFIHALISQALRENGEKSLKLLVFKNCSPLAKGIIETVVQYVLETVEDDPTTERPPKARS